MSLSKIALTSILAIACGSVYAQHNVICTPVGISINDGPVKPFSGKKIVVNMGAFNLKTATESYVGNGKENYNNQGEKWYGYTNAKTGDNAVVIFTKTGGMTLIAKIDATMLFNTCEKI